MKRTKKTLPLVASGLLASVAFGGTAMAQSADSLLDKLVEKGVLSVTEANELREETDKGFTTAYQVKSGLPDWVTALKLNGDLRARYEGFFQENDNYGPSAPPASNSYFTEDRHRMRFRLRFGAVASLTDQFEVGLRLASGAGDDPLSTNQTLDNNAAKKGIFIDLAYAKWTPTPWSQTEVGKMNNAFWFTDMVFDGDYTPEGAQQKFMLPMGDNHAVGLTAGAYVIDENFSSSGSGNNNDTWLPIGQLDWTAKWSPKLASRLGVAAYSLENRMDISSGGDLGNGNGAPTKGVDDFTPIIARGEVTYTLSEFPLHKGPFPITLGAEAANNVNARNARNKAINLGIALGSSRTKGGWTVSYNYKNIESAAVWRNFNDSDFGINGGGGTGIRGHVFRAQYKPSDPLVLGASLYLTELIDNPPDTLAEQGRLQVDAVWSF